MKHPGRGSWQIGTLRDDKRPGHTNQLVFNNSNGSVQKPPLSHSKQEGKWFSDRRSTHQVTERFTWRESVWQTHRNPVTPVIGLSHPRLFIRRYVSATWIRRPFL